MSMYQTYRWLIEDTECYKFVNLYFTLIRTPIMRTVFKHIVNGASHWHHLYSLKSVKGTAISNEEGGMSEINSHHIHQFCIYILSETFEPPLDIYSYILTYMIQSWLQFILNMGKSIEQNLLRFHFHKLKFACSIGRLYKGTIAFHFHTNAKIWTHRLKPSIPVT